MDNHQFPSSEQPNPAEKAGAEVCQSGCTHSGGSCSARPQAGPARLRRRLAEATRQASMAEVASTALHNVGNVLNSVNVSVSLAAQRLRASRMDNLGKAVALLTDHAKDLGRFLTEDPKGRMLPGYLETLAQHLASERKELIREIEVLTRSVEHMKQIVAVQQSYARKCGVMETLLPAELVEDALRMNAGAFERHGVAIERDYDETPAVTVDKHKVLQILVNLIRNAKYALDEQGAEQKRLRLQVQPAGEDTLAISVSDNGIGIAPENLARIFEHGFTTKKDGHGLGLHSGHMAALEMGGKLSAHSDGPGKGATFRLELPLGPKGGSDKNHGHSAQR
jgi:signal transduction histidine kinase